MKSGSFRPKTGQKLAVPSPVAHKLGCSLGLFRLEVTATKFTVSNTAEI